LVDAVTLFFWLAADPDAFVDFAFGAL